MSHKKYIRDFEYQTSEDPTVITTSVSLQSIFTGEGVLFGAYIGVEDNDGTFQYFDNDGVPIVGGVKRTSCLGWSSSPPRPRYLKNGLKVTTLNFTGSLEIYWSQIYRP